MLPSSRIPVTGLGVIAPGATGVGPFLDQLRTGRSGISPVKKFEVMPERATTAGLLNSFNAREFIPVLKMRRMNTLSRLGVSAMKLALADAGLEAFDSHRGDTGVALGTTFGPVQTSVEYLNEYVAKGASLAPPQLFAESVANAPGSHIAIEYGLKGFNLTFTQREASVLTSLLFAASQMIKGTVTRSVCGGIEEMNDITFSVLDRIGALARPCDEREEKCRPFDLHRDGMVVGEGGAIFLLETEEERQERGGKAYGYIAGFGIARDATASLSDWGSDAQAVVTSMRTAVEDADLDLAEIDAIFASANGSIRGDRLEYRAIQSLFGHNLPPVTAVKGYFGEYAAAGGLQLAAALLALREQFIPGTPGFESGEPEMHFRPVTHSESRPLRNVLVNSLSAGGGVVSCVLSAAT